MTELHRLALRIAGKADEDGQTVVYQKVAKGYGSLDIPGRDNLQRRAHVIPTDYRTAAQLAQRARLSNATLAWQALDEPTRATWRAQAKGQRRSGFNLFVRDWLRTHPPEG